MTDSEQVSKSGVIAALLSDHLPVFAIRKRTCVVEEGTTVVARNYKRYNSKHLTEWMLEADWEEYGSLETPNEQWDFIQEHLELFLDYNCPLVTMKVRPSSKDWMTPEIFLE